LLEFPGAVVLVTHDRFLFERVTTTVLALDGGGAAIPFADYAQWEASQRERGPAVVKPRVASAGPAPTPSTKKLTWAEQREWDGMEAVILAAEAQLARCEADASDPAVASRSDELVARCAALAAAQEAVDRFYARWAELDAKRVGAERP